MPWPLYSQAKNLWHPLDRRLGGPQSQSGYDGKEENLCPYWELYPNLPNMCIKKRGTI